MHRQPEDPDRMIAPASKAVSPIPIARHPLDNEPTELSPIVTPPKVEAPTSTQKKSANHQPLSHKLEHHSDHHWLRWIFLPVLLIGFGIIALAILVAHYHPAPPAPAPLTTIAIPAIPAAPPKIAPTPAAAPPAVLTPVAEKHLAPPGVFYLKKYLTITAGSDVFGVEAGAQVLLLEKNGDRWQVTNGPHDFEVNSADLTNDLDVAKTLIQNSLAHGHAVEPPRPAADVH